ncbi:MAG TPA: hypothetical protein CFH82_00230 [Sulfurospirillum sp. UBA12182]|jgi:hypothetical protein|nr:MAG TPA: hypothetical protein CFH82_00230 [Sulfurospirillum sp. UBA12182]
MFVGWIRKSSLKTDLDLLEKSLILDKNLILNTAFYNEQLCFGAYEDESLEALISAYVFKESVFINNFYYKTEVSKEVKKRLLKLLIENINEEKKSIYMLVNQKEKKLLESFGFSTFASFRQVLYKGGAVFNFTNAMSKSIHTQNYLPIISQNDFTCTQENRLDYITKSVFKTSSLLLSSSNGYQHSYALNQNIIKLSPWIMQEFSFDEAEKLMRGVIYHRGLKKILAYIPAFNDEITNLYRSYKFEFLEEFELMYKNEKPKINLEMVYGF